MKTFAASRKMLRFWSVSKIHTLSLKIYYASEERGKNICLLPLGFWGVTINIVISLLKFFLIGSMHAPCRCNMSIMDPTIHMVLQIRYARPVSKLCITILRSLIRNKNRKISQLLMAIYTFEK